jgi:hypothetical protein
MNVSSKSRIIVKVVGDRNAALQRLEEVQKVINGIEGNCTIRNGKGQAIQLSTKFNNRIKVMLMDENRRLEGIIAVHSRKIESMHTELEKS